MDIPSSGLKKGAWTFEEDNLLRQCIETYGEGTWHKVPLRAGLNRCRKSCRLRWLNYLKPSIKRGKLSSDEVDLVIRLHKLLGNRWSLIAGRLPGRTANDIKNYWNTHLGKKQGPSSNTKKRKKNTTCSKATKRANKVEVIKPKPQSFSRRRKVESPRLSINECVLQENNNNICDDNVTCNKDDDLVNTEKSIDRESMWLENLLEESEVANKMVPQEAEGSFMTSRSFDVEELWNLLNEDAEELG